MSEKHAELIALMKKWLAETESGYDEQTWPKLKKRLEETGCDCRVQRDRLLHVLRAVLRMLDCPEILDETKEMVRLAIAEVEQDSTPKAEVWEYGSLCGGIFVTRPMSKG